MIIFNMLRRQDLFDIAEESDLYDLIQDKTYFLVLQVNWVFIKRAYDSTYSLLFVRNMNVLVLFTPYILSANGFKI